LSSSTEIRNQNAVRHEISIENGELDSRELFKFEREIRIRHEGAIYRLRLTSLNKLILTK
jgi:hemin uptake protein HemP